MKNWIKSFSSLNIILVIGILFLCVGYATVNSISIGAEGVATASPQNNIFITDVVLENNTNGGNGVVDTYYGPTMGTTTVLQQLDSTVTFTVKIYNGTKYYTRFKRAYYDAEFYSNPDITYEITGLNVGDDFYPRDEITFTITFKYKDDVTTINEDILTSFISYEFEKVTLSSVVMDVYKETGVQGTGGMYYHNNSSSYDANDNSYRYSGADPNNYICFGSDEVTCPPDRLYRIIGVFDGETKIIKADFANIIELGTDGNFFTGSDNHQAFYSQLGGIQDTYYGYHWNPNENNNWAKSELNTVNLNTNYINYLNSWADLIAVHNWQVGGVSSSNELNNISSARQVYSYELGDNKTIKTYTAKIGLMYVSDYVYAARKSGYWGTSKTPKTYGNSSDPNYPNWMFIGDFEWTITPRNSTTKSLYRIWALASSSPVGAIVYGNSEAYAPVRPTFYLDSGVLYRNGDGSKTNPYRIVNPSTTLKENGTGEDRPEDVLEEVENMTLDEKIGQMIIMSGKEFGTTLDDDTRTKLQTIKPGGIIIYGNNVSDYTQLKTLISDIDATKTRDLIWSIDQEGGIVQRLNSSNVGATDFPNMYVVGQKNDLVLVNNVGRVIGEELKVFGFNMDFAPVADVWSNPSNTVIGQRAFASDQFLVAKMARSFSQGLESAGVTPVYKHFPGHGDTGVSDVCSSGDSHDCLPLISKSKEELLANELIPFKSGIDYGVPAIMVGHLAVPSLTGDETTPVSLSKKAITNFLRGELGFNGLVITDGLDMGALTYNSSRTIEQAYVDAINAGVDILLAPNDAQVAFNAIKSAIIRGEIDELTINVSVSRIINYKNNVMNTSVLDESYLNNTDHRNISNQASLPSNARTIFLDGGNTNGEWTESDKKFSNTTTNLYVYADIAYLYLYGEALSVDYSAIKFEFTCSNGKKILIDNFTASNSTTGEVYNYPITGAVRGPGGEKTYEYKMPSVLFGELSSLSDITNLKIMYYSGSTLTLTVNVGALS